MTALLELRDVRAGFGDRTVLRGCTYEVASGELCALLGLNGAGKTVSLDVASGSIRPWRGAVLLGGEDVTRLPAEERVARGIAHAPQGRHVFARQTVEENLRLGALVLRRRDRRRYRSVLDEMFDRFPLLAERGGDRAGVLSSGQQAVLAIARALMSEPRLLIADEPSAGLDPHAVQNVFALLRDIAASGVGVLVAEQNVMQVLGVADRVYLMESGRVVLSARAREIDRDDVAAHLGLERFLRR